MVQAVIFDMDGTVLNTLFDLTESVNFSLKKFSLPPKTIEQVRKAVGNGVYKLAKRVLPENFSEDELSKWLEIFKNHYSKNMYNHTKSYDGILDVLKELKTKGIKTAIVSNKYDSAVKELSKKYFKDLIDVSIGQSDEIEPKPSPKGIIKAINELNIQSAIYVGDSDVDIQTAQNANLPVIGVTWGFRDRENLTGADYIIDKPCEILNIIF